MTVATKSSIQSTAAATALFTIEQNELLTRAQSYLRLEEYIKVQRPAIAKRRTDEEDKLLNDLNAIPDLTANTRAADRLKAFDVSVAAIDTEKGQLHRLDLLLTARIEAFSDEQNEMFRYALEQRLKVLVETHVREQKEAEAVQAEIKSVKKRIEEISTHTGKGGAKA